VQGSRGRQENTTLQFHIVTASLLFASAFAVAQTQVTIGPDGRGCGQNGALLDNGAVGMAAIVFDYKPATALLRVTVTNTSPVVPGQPSSTITRIFFNAPAGTVMAATLQSQTAPGATPPTFALAFDADNGDGHDPNQAACLGTFNFRLASKILKDGIAPAGAQSICVNGKHPILEGPVTFTIRLTGPEVHNLSSDVFAAATSRNTGAQVNVAASFDGGACGGSGTLGNGDVCRTAVFLRGTPQIGGNVVLSVIGGEQCRAFFGLSATEGPTQLGTFVLPIGLPVLFTYDFGYLPLIAPEVGLPVFIPFAPELIGFTAYMTSLTHPYLMDQVGPWSFAPAYAVTITGGS